MSILSEILSTGHVDKELLDALDDEQKQLLFCQMRAEQVRKWQAAEEELERDGPPFRPPKKKSLKWLKGTDGEVWVWVMGEHSTDRSIEEILDEEARHQAHALAVRELGDVADANAKIGEFDEDALMAQLGNFRIGGTDSIEDDSMDSNNLLLFQPPRPSVYSNANGGHINGNGNVPNEQVTSAKVSSYTVPQPQKAEVRGQRPPLLPKPQPQFAQPQPFPSTSTNSNDGLSLQGVRMRPGRGIGGKAEEVQKRESEIFQSLQEHREKMKREAEAGEARRQAEWEDQQRKAREADAAMREMAQKAREQHRQLIRTSTSILPALKDTKATSLREAIKNLPRPPRPKSRSAIVEWFKREELRRGTGLDPKTKAPAPWFHGIISRQDAENLLLGKPTGSYLVRVSERIWGYTVSYVVGDGTFKHFLVEKISQGYQFLGTNQVVHDQLFDLVSYHETAPITAKGGEVLKWAVGQAVRPADFSDLLPEPSVLSNPFGRYPVGRF
ncbi:unnamed protein product [Caenorhabditis auriculariae]|uniref:SH2 domain-containing protein n=1 Tax=Caenorhabditis auriculariae TaxID=2777116 RepID=A0A8S1HMJ9_9PELO|nr:unnamed protein product [Caenorhabditis auriculariae]